MESHDTLWRPLPGDPERGRIRGAWGQLPPCPPSYSRHAQALSPSTNSQDPRGDRGGVTIILACPRLSSLHRCLSVYLVVMGSLGLVLASLWVTGHIYVLSLTSDYSLREQRYVDVFLGLALLVSLVCLVLGAWRARLQEVLAFLILSSLVLAAYWAWWACLAYSRGETEASKELWDTLSALTLIHILFLLAPSLPFYKNLEDRDALSEGGSAGDNNDKRPRSDHRHQHQAPFTICQ